MRRSVLVVAVALTVLLAGCAGIDVDGTGADDIGLENDDNQKETAK